MKLNRIKTLLTLLLFSLQLSCSDFLEENLYSSFSDEEVFSSVESCEMAVNGAYGALQDLYMANMVKAGCRNSDVSLYRRESYSNTDQIDLLTRFLTTDRNTTLYNLWSGLYSGIAITNRIINNIAKMELLTTGTDEEIEELNIYIAHAKFLRGWFYMDLAKLWGDVPLILEEVTANDLYPSRDPVQSVWTQVIEDLSDAAEVLPLLSERSSVSSQATKGAALAMLARAYLMAGGSYLDVNTGAIVTSNPMRDEYYKKALVALDEIIASGEYSLVTTIPNEYVTYAGQSAFVELFYSMHRLETPVENILEVAYYAGEGAATDNMPGGYVGQQIGLYQLQASVEGKATAQIKMAGRYRSMFESGDPRYDMAIGTYSIQSSDDYPNSVTSATLINYTVGKFRRHWLTDEFPSSTLNVDYTSINYPVVRYADVLLMYAECYHECEDDLPTLSSGYDKYSALNQVRTRGGSVTTLTSANIANISALLNYNQVSDFYSSTTLADVTDKSKLNIEAQSSYYADYPDDFTLLLRLERARELGGEGLRKFDLIRWGSYYHTMKAANAHYETTLSTETGVTYYSYPAAENIEVKYTLYAIPYTELINNPNLTPNPAN